MNNISFIIAGGYGKRLGKNKKTEAPFAEEILLAFIARRLLQQVGNVVAICNDAIELPGDLRIPIIPDAIPGRPGPLAGIITALLHVQKNYPGAQKMVTLPCDSPFFPKDIANILIDKSDNITPTVATCNGHRHPLFACWPVALLPRLQDWVAAGNARVGQFLSECGAIEVDFPLDEDGTDPFFNINTLEDLDEARRILATRQKAGIIYP
jgi:molybdopterin-guanine dinucleotide biosynthesis protein A